MGGRGRGALINQPHSANRKAHKLSSGSREHRFPSCRPIFVKAASRSACRYHCVLGWAAVADWPMPRMSTGSPGGKHHAKLHVCFRLTNCRLQNVDSHCLFGSKKADSADQDRMIQWHTTTCLTCQWSVIENTDDFSDTLALEQARQTRNGCQRRCWFLTSSIST